jgi:hypothetical protein
MMYVHLQNKRIINKITESCSVEISDFSFISSSKTGYLQEFRLNALILNEVLFLNDSEQKY